MKKILVLILITGFIYACGGGEPPKNNNSSKKTAKVKKAPDGKKIYNQFCVVCHGSSGDMGSSGAFDLTTTKLTVEEKINVITNGRNTMTPYKGLLSEEKIRAVAEYTEKFKK